MLTDTIKEATQTQHQQLEKALVAKMKAIRSMQGYVDLLKVFYGYFGGLEQQITQYINSSNLQDHTQRRKTNAMADDIKALGGTLPNTANSNHLPAINNPLQAFGALYVIEGSTLGGSIISKMMQQHLPFDGQNGLSFFNGYGEQTHQMWAEFKTALNAVVKTQDDEAVVLQAANDTFAGFKQWMDKQ
ncbi:MAG: heme oxygenase [Sphingobacteriaceae bacterium]|nr:MAG: heme oxygenase [Sphingobacteriaceae bacterium]